MLIVETISKIRRLAHVQGKTIKAICRELGVSRKVVRKVLRSEETEFKYERSRQPQPKLGPWRHHLDGILLANEAKCPSSNDLRGVVTLSFSGRKGQGLVDIQAKQAAIIHASKASSRW